jgi:hypothetical protein
MVLLPGDVRGMLESGADLVVSVSGGKDSDCMALELASLRAVYGWDGRFILIHADVGRMEWPQSLPHCAALADRLGAEFVVVRHAKRDLMDGIHLRMETRPDAPPFPSSAARWCTSDYKRAVIDKWLRNNVPTAAVSAIGFRREESAARAKQPLCEVRAGATAPTKGRRVLDWHPILEYRLADVWRVIGYTLDELRAIQTETKRTGIVPIDFRGHPAYAFGNERVSCALCVLGSLNDLRNGAAHNPAIHAELVEIEERSGFTFQQGRSLKVLTAIEAQPRLFEE